MIFRHFPLYPFYMIRALAIQSPSDMRRQNPYTVYIIASGPTLAFLWKNKSDWKFILQWRVHQSEPYLSCGKVLLLAWARKVLTFLLLYANIHGARYSSRVQFAIALSKYRDLHPREHDRHIHLAAGDFITPLSIRRAPTRIKTRLPRLQPIAFQTPTADLVVVVINHGVLVLVVLCGIKVWCGWWCWSPSF